MRTPGNRQQRALIGALREAREAAGLTQADLAARLDKPQSFVAKIETGARRLDVIEFARLTEVLGVDPSVILRRIR